MPPTPGLQPVDYATPERQSPRSVPVWVAFGCGAVMFVIIGYFLLGRLRVLTAPAPAVGTPASSNVPAAKAPATSPANGPATTDVPAR